ncbi:MAG: LptF/LptG family permease [Bacteroidales bacterium]
MAIDYNELAHDRRVRNKNTYPHRRDKFERQDVVFSMTGFNFSRTDETLFKTGYQMMNLDQLTKAKDSLLFEFDKGRRMFYRDMVTTNYFRTDLKIRRKNIGDTNIAKLPDSRFRKFNPDTAFLSLDLQARQNIISTALNLARSAKSYVSSQKESFAGKVERMRRHEIEWHRKFTLSIACLIFFFIGAPLGAIIRKGGLGMPVVVSVLFFVFWYVISLTGEKFAREDIIQAYVGMWLSSFILLPVGIFLTYKATTDSAILNMDTYSRFFKKIGTFLKINDLFAGK